MKKKLEQPRRIAREEIALQFVEFRLFLSDGPIDRIKEILKEKCHFIIDCIYEAI